MTWVTVFTSVFFLFLLTGLVSWLVLYIQFGNSIEKRWSVQVLNLLHDAENCVRSENQQLRKLTAERDAKSHSLHEKAFAAHLSEYSVDELEAYPGIGPVTIDKLRAEGLINLATLHRAHIHIHGLGDKRLADIDSAVREMLGKAKSAFKTGNCRQSQLLADKRKELSAHYDRLETQARTRAEEAEKFIDHLGETVAYARAVRFARWFRPISNEALIPPEVMDAALPDLESALRAAEDRIAANRHQTPAEAVPVLPISAPRRIVPPNRASKQEPTIPPHTEPEMLDETHFVLMELTIQLASAVARADGPVSRMQRELIQQHLRKRFGYKRALLNRAEAWCTHYETAAIDLERCINEILQRFTAEHRVALMGFAGQIVSVSGNDTARAAPFLHKLAQSLGVPPVALPQREPPAPSLAPPKASPSPTPAAKVAVPLREAAVRMAAAAPAIVSQPSSSVPAPSPRPSSANSSAPSRPVAPPPKPAAPTRDECLKLLEIPAGTPLSADLVRRQWNLLSERLAPEKVASMGPEFVKLAQTKLAELHQAAEWILKAMGEELETKPASPPVQDLRHNPDLDDVLGGM